MASQPKQDITIEVQNLVKRYPKASANAVDDISFSVPRGEIFGLLGPNGAGKTTTIGVLTTGILPTSGKAFLAGIDVAADPMQVKQRIAVVPQQSNLDRSLRAREILTFHASYHGVPRAERNARADALLKELGLGDRAKEKVLSYSGGMAQRLMLARALMHSPDVLFLDEPTNNLDPQSRLFLWDRIRTLHERGVTILLTTHDMFEADQLCDRIAIMDHGKVLVLDTATELKKTIPGGTFLELRVALPERVLAAQSSAPAKSDLLESLRAISATAKVEEVQGDEQQSGTTIFRLYDQNASSLTVDAVQVVASFGAEVRDMHVAHPSLEDVFIYLTGRSLR
jgi:ABC-2 type transport system ATP-binding protein